MCQRYNMNQVHWKPCRHFSIHGLQNNNNILLIYINIGYIAATGDWGSRPTEGTNLSGPRRSFFRGPAPCQGWTGLSGVPGNARGADAHLWAGHPPPSVVGRDGLAIGRFGRFPEPPAVILYLRPPPPSTIAITPPPPSNNRDNPRQQSRSPPPPPRRRSALFPRFPGPNLVPSPALQSPFMGINGRLPMLILC